MPVERFIIIAVVLGIAMLLVLLGVVLALRQRSKSSQAHQAAADDKPAPEWMKSVAGSAGKALTRTTGPNLPTDAVVIVRDSVTGEWIVQLNGIQYHTLKDIHDDRAAGKVLEALSGLQHFAGIAPAAAPDLKPKAVILPTPTAPPPDMEPVVAQAMAQGSVPSSMPLYPAPPNSILAQIEKILQRNLMRYPELAHRKIHVGAASDGSLLIEIDRQLYHHADEIAELQVRDLIKAAIHEWERTA
jgi:hypothetical protein